MNVLQLEHWILDRYEGIIVIDAYRERSFFYNPDGSMKKGIYFTTIKERDGPNDKASHLDRAGVFRLSIGLDRNSYQQLFGNVPKRPSKGGIVELDYDFTLTGVLMPHPIYAWLCWVCINNPTIQHLDVLKHLLDTAYQNVLFKFARRP